MRLRVSIWKMTHLSYNCGGKPALHYDFQPDFAVAHRKSCLFMS